MKNRKEIIKRIAKKRFKRVLRSREKKRLLRKSFQKKIEVARESLNQDTSFENILEKWLPPNLKYLLNCDKSEFHYNSAIKNIPNNNGVFLVPKEFSLIDYPKETFRFIKNVLGALLSQKYSEIIIDYTQCNRLDLDAQVILDIILKEIISFYNKCRIFKSTRPFIKKIGGKCKPKTDIEKLLYSVGSPAIHANKTIRFPDIVPYELCIHNRDMGGDPIRIREQKDIDTTKLVQYVLDSLKKINRTLADETIDNLSTVIGEILINAEEHSTTKHRFSIGYFQDIKKDGNHFGVFKLIILNFGKTIYDKFKDADCPNIDIVRKMVSLSKQYTKKKFFIYKSFEEETLWTLYSLQEGVTSIAPERYTKRGHGSIQFIESFFNIKGTIKEKDNISRMTILSGNTSIIFDGTYKIKKKSIGGDEFKFMTFNKSGNIEDKPDDRFVKFVDNYFPGTIISAQILFNNDDITECI